MVSLGNIGLKEYYFEEGGAVDGGVRMIATPSGWVRPPGKLLYRVPATREAVRAQPGFKLLISDLSQIEIKLMTLLSQDPWLMAAVNSGKDMHCYMAADVSAGLYEYDILIGAKKGKLDDYFAGNPRSFHASRWGSPVDRETLIDELVAARSNVKSISFMIPYGATVEGIAAAIRKRDKLTGAYTESMDDALERAQKLLDDYFGKARVLKQYLERCKRNGIKHGMAKSPKGRIRHFTLPELQDPDYKRRIAQMGRWSQNFPMQSGCVDVLKPAAARLYRNLRGGVVTNPVLYDGARIMLLVHDEIVATARDPDHLAPVSELIKEAMTWAYNDIHAEVNGQMHYLSEIKNKVDVITADYWLKD
jgi:DNA polymerase-1